MDPSICIYDEVSDGGDATNDIVETGRVFSTDVAAENLCKGTI